MTARRSTPTSGAAASAHRSNAARKVGALGVQLGPHAEVLVTGAGEHEHRAGVRARWFRRLPRAPRPHRPGSREPPAGPRAARHGPRRRWAAVRAALPWPRGGCARRHGSRPRGAWPGGRAGGRRSGAARLPRRRSAAAAASPGERPPAGAGSSACSSTTCTFVPDQPKELTPATRRPVRATRSPRWAVRRSPASSRCRARTGQVEVGRDRRRAPARETVLMKPAIPAAPSRCPTFVFTAPTTQRPLRVTPRPEDVLQRGHLDGVTEPGSRSVGLDEGHLAWGRLPRRRGRR